MNPPHKIWIDQVEATAEIREKFGLEKALGYIVGEKFLKHLEYAETNVQFRAEIGPMRMLIDEGFYEDLAEKYNTLLVNGGSANE